MKKRFFAILIAVCVLSILSLTACSSMIYGFEDSDVVVASKYGYQPMLSYRGDGMLTFSPSEEGYVFELYARDGSFHASESDDASDVKIEFPSEILIEGSGNAYWTDYDSSLSEGYWNGAKTYIDVFIKKDGQYVGYSSARLDLSEDNSKSYFATILECKETTVEKAREKGLDREKLQELIDSVIEKDK